MSDVACPRVGRLSRVGLFRSNPSNRGVHIVRKTELGQHVSIQGRLWTCGSGLDVQVLVVAQSKKRARSYLADRIVSNTNAFHSFFFQISV